MNINKLYKEYENLELEEAVSHRVHSRIFEALGYLDMIEKDDLKDGDLEIISRVEDICRSLISELHFIIEQRKNPGVF